MLRTIHPVNTKQECKIEYQLTIYVEPCKVFAALTNGNIIDEWGGGPARVQPKVHGEISFWDAEMYGCIRELEPPNLLVHTLRHAQWEKRGADSLVRWKLVKISKGTLLQMQHIDLPNRKARDNQNELWASCFLGPLKAYLQVPPFVK